MAALSALFAVKTFNRLHYLHDCLSSFLLTRGLDVDWTIVVADDGSTDGTLQYLENYSIDVPLYIIRNSRRYAVGQFNTIVDFFGAGEFDCCFCVDDDVYFKSEGWAQDYIKAMRCSGFSHLCYYDRDFSLTSARRVTERPFLAGDFPLSTYGGVESCMGCFFTFDRAVVDAVGYADEQNFPVHGQWHIDYSMRCCRAGFNSFENFCDIRNSSRWIGLQDHFSFFYRGAERRLYDGRKKKSASEKNRRFEVMWNQDRVYLPAPSQSSAAIRIC